ncbi:MAG: D-alanyl-D-alanine dipeptidase [Bacillota bacterium]
MRCGRHILAPVLAVLLGLTVFSGGCGQKSEAPTSKNDAVPLKNTDFVNLQEYIPALEIDLVYATENNFTGQKLYDSPAAYLRKGTADKLKRAAEEVNTRGYRLKIWDAYRPPQAQVKMWNTAPDPRYLADPRKGSDHSRGCAVDLTLIDPKGNELDMPSGFDDFSPRADRDYSDVSPEQRNNAMYLEKVMVKQGFFSIWREWWHFADSDRKAYDVAEKAPLPNTEN